MRILILILLVLLAILNHRLWLSDDGGFQKVWLLQDAIKAQDGENNSLKERNQTLEAEVKDLKGGFAAVEERARLELGMIGQGETFFHILEGLPPSATVLAVQKPPTQQPVLQKQWRQKVAQEPIERQPAAQKSSAKQAKRQPAAHKPARKPAVQQSVVQQVAQKQPVQKPAAQKPAIQKPARSQPQGPRLTKHND
ncbi:MAG TPA: cell division protein FtsB [Candidatus Competibacteraceae bacterium]|nr:cell division protein FtsB [Candidatus Competibacteraceae bacterium]